MTTTEKPIKKMREERIDLSSMTAEDAAKATYERLRMMAQVFGMKPDSEVAIYDPERADRHGYVGPRWHVVWEAGPHDWGVEFSLYAGPLFEEPFTGLKIDSGLDYTRTPKGWHLETYWGFDLIFEEYD